MMSIRQLKERKKELGYTNEMVAEKSGVPLSTVQKIFCGATRHPRYDTLLALTKALSEYNYDLATYVVQEEAAEYSVEYERQFQEDTNSRWPRQGHYTVQDIRALPDEIRVELIDGVIYDMTAPKLRHQRILFQVAPRDVRLFDDDRHMEQPDILITCDKSKDLEDYYDGAPELTVEILSPSTRRKDFIVKTRYYEMAGVREYWIVDPAKENVLVFFFEEDKLPVTYSFDDEIPVRISEGKCVIDFKQITDAL